MLEVCCGSYEDAKNAERGGADRIELNSALYLGGLTPSIGTLELIKENLSIETVVMVRPRGGGFYYTEEEYEVILCDAKQFLQKGCDGIAFGFLNENRTVDVSRTKKMVDLIRSFDKEPVFHRAFDVTEDMEEAMEQIIACGCTRLLTSGQMPTAMAGIANLTWLHEQYGKSIDFVAGSGVNETNAQILMKQTGILSLHSSCKAWQMDVTAEGKNVSFGFQSDLPKQYDVVSSEKVRELANIMKL